MGRYAYALDDCSDFACSDPDVCHGQRELMNTSIEAAKYFLRVLLMCAISCPSHLRAPESRAVRTVLHMYTVHTCCVNVMCHVRVKYVVLHEYT